MASLEAPAFRRSSCCAFPFLEALGPVFFLVMPCYNLVTAMLASSRLAQKQAQRQREKLFAEIKAWLRSQDFDKDEMRRCLVQPPTTPLCIGKFSTLADLFNFMVAKSEYWRVGGIPEVPAIEARGFLRNAGSSGWYVQSALHQAAGAASLIPCATR